jgi:hypothetical protein
MRESSAGGGLERVVFDLASSSRDMTALSLSAGAPWKEALAVRGAYFIPENSDFFRLIDEGTAFYTDREYRGLYGEDFSLPPAPYRMRRWGIGDFVRAGAVAWSRVNRLSGEVEGPEAGAEILVPAGLRGLDLVFEVKARAITGAGDPACGRILASVPALGGIPAALALEGIRIPLPQEAFRGATAFVKLSFPEYRSKSAFERSIEVPADVLAFMMGEPEPGSAGEAAGPEAPGRDATGPEAAGPEATGRGCRFVIERAGLVEAPDAGLPEDGGDESEAGDDGADGPGAGEDAANGAGAGGDAANGAGAGGDAANGAGAGGVVANGAGAGEDAGGGVAGADGAGVP